MYHCCKHRWREKNSTKLFCCVLKKSLIFLFVDVFVICDVLNDFSRREELFCVVVRNLESELVLHGHDDLDVVQRVQTQVVDEVRLQSQLQWEKSCLYKIIQKFKIIFLINSVRFNTQRINYNNNSAPSKLKCNLTLYRSRLHNLNLIFYCLQLCEYY